MLKALPAPRAEVSPHAPRMVMMKIDPARIGELIGPGGKVIRMLQEKTSTKIDVEDDGTVMISSIEGGDEKACREMVQALVGEIKVGSYFESTVVSVKDFGCFVELVPGREGLVHVSEISDAFIKDINSAVRIGDKFRVKVTGVDAQGRIKLSRKQVILEEKQQA
jgi:polyribonucleotide nucleotidyltransferase